MVVSLVSTGDEILFGEVIDTNAAFAASQLCDYGFQVKYHFTCGDRLEDLQTTFRQAMKDAETVIVCGGLGPTQDDRSVEALAQLMKVETIENQEVLTQVQKKLQAIGVPLTENQKRQARLPLGAQVLPNPIGTAPGILVSFQGCRIFCLPGPPREYQLMLKEEVLPMLVQERIQTKADSTITTRILRVFGKGEGWVEQALGNLEAEVTGLSVGFQASFPEILVKLRMHHVLSESAEKTLDQAEKLARQRLGNLIYAVGEKSLAATVLDVLVSKKKTLAVAESCTGGLVGKLLTDIAGSSASFVLSVVTYSNEMKQRLLGVPRDILESKGAVSRECAQAMAEGVRKVSGADVTVAVTGIAGPQGGSLEKPVGTVCFAVGDQNGMESTQKLFAFRDREFVRCLSAYTALALVHKRVIA